jgi:ParB family chromosome partitioning protein
MENQAKHVQSRPRLGRGLSSLIVNSAELSAADDRTYQHVTGLPPVQSASHGQPQEIPLDQIAPNPFQPRRQFDPEDLAELAESIRLQGVLQPLIVAKGQEGSERPFVLIAGERRLRAARQVGLTAVPCITRQATTQQMLEWALIENIQRADLNPLERAQAYRDFMDRFNLTQAEAAARLGQPRANVANYLRILDLCDEIQGMLTNGSLTFGHAKLLAGLADPTRQLRLARKVVNGCLSVRQLESLLADATAAPPAGSGTPHSKAPYLADLEQRLSQAVGSRVTVRPGRAKHSGRIVIEYYSLDDFDRIASVLGMPGEELHSPPG